jgi:SAM-dependent methyltransferase
MSLDIARRGFVWAPAFSGERKGMKPFICCPRCHRELSRTLDVLLCESCARSFPRNSDGFYVLLSEGFPDPKQQLEESYVRHQETYPIRVYREFLGPLIRRAGAKTLLDVGCGLGTEVKEALKDGYDAYGIDLPNMTPHWKAASNDPMRFLGCSAVSLPLPDNTFDFVWSLGVIEHIGTAEDTATLVPAFRSHRVSYANELLRVTKPGGRIIVSCPNKSFPIDIQHGPTSSNHLRKLRWYIFNKTGLNFHKTWGKYHLLSYSEARGLFMQNSMAGNFSPLPLHGYYGFNKFQSGYLRLVRSAVTWYIDHLRNPLLTTFLNPCMLVLIEKNRNTRENTYAISARLPNHNACPD